MNVQFADKRNPTGPPLVTVALNSPPRVGEHVTLPGGRATVVRSVHWVWADDGKLSVAVVVE